ncbi:hypothetical protein TBLA_0B02680 [Henningerozyma blattae CBS 6284]|uniref:Altered inheritance of mitochondria protein 39, mitochondrial n=1 Tax=Henningerozyma blattae (strain ATCC 34711 / CBS 6284 / DSM 70876 / NBRC 10599 / NRRL Y-10934 / UCD 77-7) TaxID=1071380 RepID=I2GYA8_HENB6|nr:hypothetical protein TBLA_0B02680 [Tetrapisispora blattae CBS 6284]CCH59110.1 hypothetical protein TBLA_0B02680 [Tetrapisispora blattae CBS 6284]
MRNLLNQPLRQNLMLYDLLRSKGIRTNSIGLFPKYGFSKKYYSSKEDDSKYIFSKKGTEIQNNVGVKDYISSRHFFTKPTIFEKMIKSFKLNNSNKIKLNRDENEDAILLGDIISKQRAKQRRKAFKFALYGTFGGILGYFVLYKVLYLREESFLPLYPASKKRKLSDADLRKLDLSEIEELSKIKVLGILSSHPMIKEQYGVPLYDENKNPLEVKNFHIWCEDQDPCVTGILFQPDPPSKFDENYFESRNHSWYRIPYVLKWRLTHRPVYISHDLLDIFQRISNKSNDMFELISPEKVYGSFKYEYSLPGDDHSLHIKFSGEVQLGKDSLIVYKGKYHFDSQMVQVFLLRRENNELVKYMLYDSNKSI